MRETVFLIVAIAAFIGAAFVPGGAADNVGSLAGDEAGKGPERGETARLAELEQWSAGETTLDRAGDGHFYAEVKVNGQPVEVLVDTGASVVALTGSDAAALGLNWADHEVSVIGSGASGPVMGVPVQLDRVELGGHEATSVEAVIVPEGLGVTLLGQSFLSTIDPVRIEGDQMVLGG